MPVVLIVPLGVQVVEASLGEGHEVLAQGNLILLRGELRPGVEVTLLGLAMVTFKLSVHG